MKWTKPLVLCLAAWLALPIIALAQTYPAKPIRIIVPYPPGGSSDLVARLVQVKMGPSVGQAVIVDNRAGANAMIGSEVVARAAPDGYTILFTTPAPLTSVQFTTRNVPYDAAKDFTPITAAVTQSAFVFVNASLPVKSIPELIDYAKRNPGKLSYGTPNIGSTFHISGELFKLATGIDIVHIPYKGGGPVVQAVIAGEVPMAIISNTSAMSALNSGKVRALAALEPKRVKELPNVPTMAEFVPGFQRPLDWIGFLGPAGLPQPIVGRLHAEILKALNAPDTLAKLASGGLEVFGSSPAEFDAMIKRETEFYRKGLQAAGIKPE